MPFRSRSESSRALAHDQPSEPVGLALHEHVDGKGRGVFTVMPFAKGAEVLEFLGEVRDVSEFQDLTHALQVGASAFLGPSGGIDDFVNHSCAPNTGIRDVDGRVVLFALRDIATGEEVTFDYSTTQSGGHWTMACQCGATQCRGKIGDFKDLPASVKSFYVRSRAVLSFLVED